MVRDLTTKEKEQIDGVLYDCPEAMEYAKLALQNQTDRHSFIETRAQLYVGVLTLAAGAEYIIVGSILGKWNRLVPAEQSMQARPAEARN